MRFSLARLVEAEIVSPYCRILINTSVGNQPRHLHGPWGQASFKASGEALDIHCLYKEIRIPSLHHAFSLSLPIHSRAPVPKLPSFSPQKSTPTMSGSGAQGKWMASSVTEKDIMKLREAGYLAPEISHWLPAKGQIVPTPKPHERGCSFPTSSAG